MPVTRKQQVLAKVETSEGVSASPGASDAVLVFDPALSDSVDVQERVPSGPTLSRDFTPIGRKTRQVTFKSDLRGSADVSIPITEPDWAKFLQAAGYKTSTITKLTVGAVTGTGFQVGEILKDTGTSLIRGTIIGAFTSGGVLVDRLTDTGGHLVIVPIAGTFTAVAVTGESSASTCTLSAVAAYEGVAYQPTSEKLVNVTTGAYTGTPPAAVGEVLIVEDATTTVRLGAVQIITNNSGMVDIDVVLLQGSIANGNKLRSVGNGLATISAAPTQKRTPSLTIRHNLDGRQRDLLGARGDFSVEGEVGQPMQFSWTFSGDLGTALDAPAIVTTGLSTVRPPRLLGAFCMYGTGTSLVRLATKRVAFNNGGVVNPNLDANRAGGATGSNVTDRDPSFTFQVDNVQSSFDWEALRDAGTVVRLAFLLGTTKGNIMGIVAPVCQVTEASLSDADGISTFDVTVKPRRIQESGDDEVVIAQL